MKDFSNPIALGDNLSALATTDYLYQRCPLKIQIVSGPAYFLLKALKGKRQLRLTLESSSVRTSAGRA